MLSRQQKAEVDAARGRARTLQALAMELCRSSQELLQRYNELVETCDSIHDDAFSGVLEDVSDSEDRALVRALCLQLTTLRTRLGYLS